MRAFLISALLALVIAAAGAIGLGLWQPTLENPWPWSRSNPDDVYDPPTDQKPKFKPGPPLYEPKTAYAEVGNPGLRGAGPDSIVIPDCHLVVFKKQTVGSRTDGMVLFVGRFLAMLDEGEIEGYRKKFANDYAVHRKEDIPVQFGDVKKFYVFQPWDARDIVGSYEMVGMLNPAMAVEDVRIAQLAVQVAKSEERSAKAVYKETIAQLDLANQLYNKGSISAEERRLKELAVKRTSEDLITKGKMIVRAERELDKAKTVLKKHEIRNMMGARAVIKAIYKQRGEDAKTLEPVMELQNIELLRAEGLMDGGYLYRIDRARRKGRKPRVRVEPVYNEQPQRVLKGHQGDVTSVAVTGHESPFIVSASTDKTVRIWPQTTNSGAIAVIAHPAAVRVVAAAASKDGKRHWCLAGCDDGSVHLYDLTKITITSARDSAISPVWSKSSPHVTGGVTAIAFSPEAEFFATGGEDGDIVVWKTLSGETIYTLDAAHGAAEKHDGPITAIHFTPKAQLVSASTDKSLRVWNVYANGATLALRKGGRDGSVAQLGVSRNGRYLLLDQRRKLQLLSADTGYMTSELTSPGATTSFETLALFSPDSKLMLTAGAADGRMQLWKTPDDYGRGMELRNLVTKEGQAVTCAAFAPTDGRKNTDESFAVSGSRNGYVYLWRIPGPKEVEEHAIRNLKLDLEDRSLAGGNQIRIGVNVPNPLDVQNPYGRLVPGSRVTIVIEP